MRTNETFEHEIDGKPMRLIVIGGQSMDAHLSFTGEKAQGMYTKMEH
jgi:hypothetical protein